jgi:redox-sensitive bicupin YhaK (pirin superfamily)
VEIQEKDLWVLLYAGKPVREPVFAKGPFVMNTEEEIRQEYRYYMNREFGK